MLKFIISVVFVISLPLLAIGAPHQVSPPPHPVVVAPAPPPPPAKSQAPPAQPVKSIDGNFDKTLDAIDGPLTKVQDELKKKNLTDEDLKGFQQLIVPLPDKLSAVIAEATPYLADVKMRLEQIGEKTALPEDPHVTTERSDLQKSVVTLDGVLKRANLFIVEDTQAQATIDARRKDIFAHSSWLKGFIWDIPDDLHDAFFGFKVGDLVISPFRISVAVLLFATIIVVTRMILAWADRRILSRLDFDVRNSMHTTFGYIGVIVAFCFAINYLGVDFGKLAIIAGALSVGVGFGLQAIASNFVAGLIILWERSIRIGDLIIVGADRGVVSKISIRATVINTFDCSQVIIPNSMLISAPVTNFVHNDRTGRVVLTFTVSAFVDPGEICTRIYELVRDCPLVLKEPFPLVEVVACSPIYGLDFEVSAWVADIMTIHKVKSDIYFLIVDYLKQARILELPSPPPPETKAKPLRKKDGRFRSVNLDE